MDGLYFYLKILDITYLLMIYLKYMIDYSEKGRVFMEKRIELTNNEIYEAKSSAVFNALCKKAGVEPNLMKLRAVIVGSSALKFKEALPSKKSNIDKVVEEFNKVYNDGLLIGVSDEILLEFISTLSEKQ